MSSIARGGNGVVLATTLTVLALVMAACGGGSSASDGSEASDAPVSSQPAASEPGASAGLSGEPIVIGALLPITGSGALYGEGMAAAAELAVDDVNAAGGIDGRPLELVIEDDATDPDTAVRGAEKLLSVDNARAIVGVWTSAQALAVAPLTIEADAVMMTTAGSPDISDLDDNGTVLRIGGNDLLQGTIMGQYAYDEGYERAAVITNSQAGTEGFATVFADAFEEAGGEVTEFVSYPEAQSSYRTEVQRILATEPDMVLLSCFSPDGTIIAREAFEEGADLSTWFGRTFCMNATVMEELGPDVSEGFKTFGVVPAQDSAAFEALEPRFNDMELGLDLFDNVYAAHVYDAVITTALGMLQSGSTDGADVAAATTELSIAPGELVSTFEEAAALIEAGDDVDYDGVSGPVDFDDAGDSIPLEGIYEVQDGVPVFIESRGL